MNAGGTPLSLLLVEPAFVLRRTVTVTARSLHLAEMHEATSVPAGQRLIESTRFDGLLLALALDDAGYALLQDVRSGRTKCAEAVPIALMLEQCGPDEIRKLRDYQLHRILLKPYKVKSVLDVLSSMATQPRAH